VTGGGKLAVSLGALVALCVPSIARAQTIWDIARQPGLRNIRHDVAAEQFFVDMASGEPERARLLVARVRYERLLERAPDDPDVLQGLADVLSHSGPEHLLRARALVLRAREVAVDVSQESSALFLLGIVETRRHDFAAAVEAYRALLRMRSGAGRRGSALCNLAESYLTLRQLEPAIENYLACTEVLPQEAMGFWGLASAYDRDSRLPEARRAAAQAVDLDPHFDDAEFDGGLSGPTNFFEPPYELHYYVALGLEAAGRPADALARWQRYLDEGGRAGPWAARAQHHIEALVPGAPVQARSRRPR